MTSRSTIIALPGFKSLLRRPHARLPVSPFFIFIVFPAGDTVGLDGVSSGEGGSVGVEAATRRSRGRNRGGGGKAAASPGKGSRI